MGWLDRIAECNRHDLANYRPLFARGVHVGHVRSDRAAWLAMQDDLVQQSERHVAAALELRGADFDELTASFDALLARIVARGDIERPYGEAFPVFDRSRRVAHALIDRSIVSWCGIGAFGVHVNGFVREPHDPDPRAFRMWIAVRAVHKSTFPGQLDNIVAGGQPHGITPRANVVKECDEEASIPRSLAELARPVGAVSYCVEHERGLKPDTMFCFDLELPPPDRFTPTPRDGEVERFELWPIERVAEVVRDTRRFKFNCNLVVIDFLVRHGLLCCDDPDYTAIVEGLRQPLRDLR